MGADVLRPERELHLLLLRCEAIDLAAHPEKSQSEALPGEFLQRDGALRTKPLQRRLKGGEVDGFLAAHDGIVVVEHEAADVGHGKTSGFCFYRYHITLFPEVQRFSRGFLLIFEHTFDIISVERGEQRCPIYKLK